MTAVIETPVRPHAVGDALIHLPTVAAVLPHVARLNREQRSVTFRDGRVQAGDWTSFVYAETDTGDLDVTVRLDDLKRAVKAAGKTGFAAVTGRGDAVQFGQVRLPATKPDSHDAAASRADLPSGSLIPLLTVTPQVSAALTAVLKAAGEDMTLPVLTALQLSTEAGVMSAVCTDRYRLHHAEVKAPADDHAPVLIPARWLAAAVKAKDTWTLSRLPNLPGVDYLHVKIGPVALLTRTVEFQFPAWRRLIPTGGDRQVWPLGPLADAARTLAQVAPKKGGTVELAAERGRLAARAFDGTEQVYEQILDIPVTEFGPARFNPRFLADALSTQAGDTVTVHHTGPDKLVMFTSDSGVGALVMPVRVR